MEPKVSLMHSQVPATCPYPEPDQSSPCPHPNLVLSFHLCVGLPSGSFHQVTAPVLSHDVLATRSAGIILALIIGITFGMQYRS